jgi:hypothetical protein
MPGVVQNQVRLLGATVGGVNSRRQGRWLDDELHDALIARYPAAKRLRPEKHDWNDALRTRS